MKKVLLFTILVFAALTTNKVLSAEYNAEEFTDNFKNCEVYSTSDFLYKKQIMGWRAGKCIYIEKDNTGKTTRCSFIDSEIQELAEAIRFYSYSNQKMTLKYTNGEEESFYTGSASINDWTKFLNMIGVCYIQK